MEIYLNCYNELDCCENCKYYSCFECTHEDSEHYLESVDEEDCCYYHSRI